MQLPKSKCPHCENLLDDATGVGHKDVPSSGDFTICFYCATWLIFNDDLTLRLVEDVDIKDLPLDKFEFLKEMTTRLIELKNAGELP